MEKGKVRGIAALFAALLALVLAAFLCMGFPVREANAAESDWIVSQEEAVASVTSGGETKYYKALRAALNYAPDGAVVEVLKDTSDAAEGSLGTFPEGTSLWNQVARKSLTVNGNDHTLTATVSDYALYVVSGPGESVEYEFTLNDLNIVCSAGSRWPFYVCNGNYDVTLNNVTLDNSAYTAGSEPVFAVGGNGTNTTVTINESDLLGGNLGYAVMVLNPAKITVTGSSLEGRSALLMSKKDTTLGSMGSEVTFSGCTMNINSALNDTYNEEFGAFTFMQDEATVKIENCKITSTVTGNALQHIVFYSGMQREDAFKNLNVNFTDTDITMNGGEEVLDFFGGDYADVIPEDPEELEVKIAGGTFNRPIDEQFLADGFELSLGADGSYTVVDTKETVATITRGENTYWYESLAAAFAAAQDGDTIVVVATAAIPERIQIEKSVTLDLNGQTVTVAAGIGNRSALDVRAGTFTLIDSSENGTGVIDATGADSAPDEGTVPLAAMAEGATVIVRSGKIVVNTNSESCLFAGFGGVVYIYGGTFINECTEPFYWDKTSPALAVNVHDNAAYEDGTQGMIISGGTFVGRNPLLGDTNGKITGSYLAENAVVALAADGSFTAYPSIEEAQTAGAGTVYTTDAEGKTVATVYSEEALAAAVTGDSKFADNNYDVVRLGKSLTQSIEVPQGRTLTLDLNGFTLTNTAGQHTIINNGTLTVIGNGTVDNVSNGHGALVNYGTATLLGGTYTRSAEAGTDSGPNGNSWYVIDNNKGMLTICTGATVSSSSAWSSMIRNVGGADRNATLLIEGGAFNGGLNTVKNDDYGMLTIQGGEFTNTAQHVIMNWSTAVIEGGTFTPSDEASSAVWSGTWYLPEDAGFVQGKTVIKGGTFNGAISEGVGEGAPNQTSDGVDYDVSGGTFTQPVDEEYFADGFELSLGADGSYTVVETEKTVATITRGEYTYWFESLDAAFAAAEDGDTVVLLADMVTTGSVVIDKGITFDLGGNKLSGSGMKNLIAVITDGAAVTIRNGSIEYQNGGTSGNALHSTHTDLTLDGVNITSDYYGVVFIGNMMIDDAETADRSEFDKLVITGDSTISAFAFAVSGNGSSTSAWSGTDITVENATLNSEAGAAVYHPQYGVITLTQDAVLTGCSGIEIRAGELNINGAQITANGTFLTDENGQGNTTDGAAIIVVQHSTKKAIEVNVTDGTFSAVGEGGRAFYQGNPQKNDQEAVDKIEMSVQNGTFNGIVESENFTGFVSGGNFNALDAKYVAKDAVLYLQAGGTYSVGSADDAVEAGAIAIAGRVAYDSLQAAIDAAAAGDTVLLLGNVTQSITIGAEQNLTLDLNGFTLTNTAGQHTIINNGTLTVIDSSAEKTGTVTNVTSGKAAFYNGENATATLSGGTFTRTAANNHYVIQNHGTMEINDGVTMLQPSKSSSGIASGWYTPGDESQRTYLTINGGTFASNGITVKNDEINELIINGGTFDNVDGYLANQSVQNWAIGTIAGGTFYSNIYSWAYENDSGDVVRGNLTISGSDVVVRGNIEAYYLSNSGAQIIDESGEVLVEEGMFYNPVRKSYLSETSALSYNAESGTYSIVSSEEPQAQIERGDSVYAFATLADAIAVAQNGDTVVLLGDVNLTEALTIDKNVTIDLAGYTIGAEGTAANITADVTIESSEDGGAIVYTGDGADHGLVVTKNATLTIEGVVVNYADGGQAIRLGDYNGGIPTADGGNAVLTNVTVTGGVAGVAMFGTAEGSANKTSLTATDSSISGTVYYGIATNGTFYNNVISLTGTNVSAPETTGTAMYLPGSGETTITGGEIKGATGIEIRAGELTVNEGTTVTATGAYTEPVPNPNGTTVGGVAIVVSQHTTERPIDVTVNGGTINATGADGKAFLEIDTVGKEDVPPSKGVEISIVGGIFNAPVEARNITGFISGGKYAENPAEELFAEGLEGAYYGASGYYEVIESVSDDLGALLTAQANAQADVRGYAASNGMSWTYVQELSANAESALQAQAAALLAAYTDITTATNEYGVAQARLAAIDAVDALISAFDALKEAAIGEIDAEAGEDVVVPTATYAAIYAAETEAELAALKAYALAEIGDIRTYRGQINGIIEDLTDAQSGLLAQIGKLETLVDDTTGTLAAMQTSLEQKIAAVQTAVDACATSSEIGQLKTDLQTAITEAVNGLKNTLVGENGTSGVIGGLQTALNNANTALGQLTGALLNSAKDGLADSITSAQNNINSILQGIASLATSEDVDAALAAILEDLAAVQTAVDSIADSVSASTAVEEAKTDALDEIRTWLNGYLDDIIGGDTAQAGIAVQSVAYTEETTDGEIYGKLTQAFSEENANLVLRYYNEALAAIDAATTVSEVTTAVSTFRAQVASVEAAAQNTPGLTGVYVLLAIVLVLIIVACIIMLVKGRREVAEQAEPAAEPVQKAQPEEAPAAAEEAPAEEVREAQPEPQPEPAQEAPAQPEAEEDDDKEKIVIAANVRSFSEAYMDLDEEQRALFGKVRDYALAKEGAVEVKQSGGLCIKRDGKQIVKLTVRRNMPVALFLLENEMLKDFRRSAKSEAKLKVRATELVIRDEEDLETAYTMVDLSVDQIEKDIEAAKERRREARRQRRLQRQAEEAAAKAQADEAAAEQAPAEDAPASDEGGEE